MSLSKTFELYRLAIRDFYDDPGSSQLFMLVSPEAEPLAAKLVASVEAEKTSDEITFAYNGPFSEPASYYAAASQAILDNVAEHRDALQKERIEIEPIHALDFAYEGASPELLFADFAERCSRALYQGVGRRTVVLLRAEFGDSDELKNAFVTSVLCLAAAGAMERTKLVVFVPPDIAVPSEVLAPQRLNVDDPRTPKERTARLYGFIVSPQRRVLVLRSGQDSAERTLAELDSVVAMARRSLRTVRIDLPVGRLADIGKHALVELRKLASARGVTLAPDSARLGPIDQFAARCEDWIRSSNDSYQELLVILTLQQWSEDDAGFGRDLLMALNNAACSPRVRYLLLDETRTGLSPILEEAPRRVSSLRIAPDAGAMESGLKSQLDKPDLPVPERIQCLTALAAIANTRKDHLSSLDLLAQAFGLATHSNDASSLFMVWLGIGQSFYSAGAWEKAENAYSHALSTALDNAIAPGIAQSTLGLADSLLCGEKLSEAILCYQSAADWYDKLGVPLFSCHALTWMGETQRRAKDLDAARQTWNGTLERYELLGDDFRDARTEGKKQVLARLVRLDQEKMDARAESQHKGALVSLGPAPILVERP